MFCDFDWDDVAIGIMHFFLFVICVFLLIFPSLIFLHDYDSTVDAIVVNVELEGGNFPDRLVSYEYEINGVIYRDIDDVDAKSYYAIGDVITIEYQSADITNTRIKTEE